MKKEITMDDVEDLKNYLSCTSTLAGLIGDTYFEASKESVWNDKIYSIIPKLEYENTCNFCASYGELIDIFMVLEDRIKTAVEMAYTIMGEVNDEPSRRIKRKLL